MAAPAVSSKNTTSLPKNSTDLFTHAIFSPPLDLPKWKLFSKQAFSVTVLNVL